ncbi:hypothetical protein ACFV1G_21175 [Streptomyces anulatus]|uniref:hypothetical protein n=1 Tax=Streptomyces anulatus TaxID=1892 RepID=UPI0036B5B35A
MDTPLKVAEHDVAHLRNGLLAALSLYGEGSEDAVDRLIRSVERRCAARLRAASVPDGEEDKVRALADFIEPGKGF